MKNRWLILVLAFSLACGVTAPTANSLQSLATRPAPTETLTVQVTRKPQDAPTMTVAHVTGKWHLRDASNKHGATLAFLENVDVVIIDGVMNDDMSFWLQVQTISEPIVSGWVNGRAIK
jgi:hypothetical protein